MTRTFYLSLRIRSPVNTCDVSAHDTTSFLLTSQLCSFRRVCEEVNSLGKL